MDLFSITCTTCKSRLKVREEGVIGQILACPKCGGMVLVKPPPGWEPGKPLAAPQPELPPGITAVVEVRRPNETLGDSNFDAVDDLLSDAPARPKQSTVSVSADAPGLAKARFVSGPPHAPSHPPVNGKPAPAATAETVKSNGQMAAELPLPPPQWSQQRPWRYWALLAGSIVAGIVLVMAVVVASRNLFPASSPVAEVPTVTSPVTPQPSPTIPVEPAVPVVPQPETPDPPAPMPMPMPVDPAAENLPAQPPVPTPPQAEDPLGLTKPPVPTEPPNGNGPDQLAAFNNILNPETDPITKPAAPLPEAAPAPPVGPPAPEKPVLPRPAPRSVNITARLADPLPAIEAEGTPLVDFLQVLSDLSTVPITLEPDGVPFTKGATVASPISLKLTNASIGSALAAGLKQVGLEHVVAGDQLIVRLIEPSAPPVLKYPVKDLTGGDLTKAAEVAVTLQALTDPAAWAPAGIGAIDATKADTLSITQRREIHAQLFFTCEKLRTARKLPHASSFSPALFALSTRSERAAAVLATPITLNFSTPTPLVRILARLEQTAGVRILVDWRDVAAAGWNPEGEATVSVEKTPLAETLTKLLEPMDLAWRIVDGSTLQVVTPGRLAERLEIELYPAGTLTAADPTGLALMAKIRGELGAATFRDGGGNGELRFDDPSQCLLAALPQPKQQELAALLARLAGPAKIAPAIVPPAGGK